MTKVTFVDEYDNIIGSGTKQDYYDQGLIHRIVRIFLLNKKGELLIQKRSQNRPYLPNKWDQSAAGHVDVGEEYETAAKRELEEEVGIKDVTLKSIGKIYTEETDEPQIKKRFNTLYIGNYDGEVYLDPEEVSETKWIATKDLDLWIKEKPNEFTEGFRRAFRFFMENNLH